MTTLRLDGIIPAVALPMTPDGNPDLEAFAAYLRWISDQGPIALAVNADTGEGPHLSADERMAVLHAALEAVGDRLPIIAGLAGPYTGAAVAAARSFERAGAAGLLVFPIPAYGGQPLDGEIPYAYHAAIADASPLPLVLFQLQPALGGVIFEDATLERLVEIPSVVALKEASFDAVRFVRTRDLLRALRPISFLTGNDNFIHESFVLGADGALIGMAAIATRHQVDLFEAHLAGDVARAAQIAARLDPLFTATFAPPVRNYRARIKDGLVMQGIIPSAAVRAPLHPISTAEHAAMRRAIAAIGEAVHA